MNSQPKQTTTFRDVFEHNKIYEAPIFQRRYKWTTTTDKELPKFWDDFSNLESEASETLFLGANITKTANVSNNVSVERSVIVDGQQRLTTVSLTLLAAAVVAESRNFSQLAETLVGYLTIDKRPNDKGRPKVIVTTPDLAEYESLFRRLSKRIQKGLTLGPPQLIKGGRLTQAFEYSKERIEERLMVEIPTRKSP